MSEDGVDSMIASLRALASPSFAEEIARHAAPRILELVQTSAENAQSPSGEAWRPRKADGAPALQKAAANITVRVVGSIVQLQVPYPYSIHHYMTGTETRPRRQILPDPDAPLPGPIAAEIGAAAGRVFIRTAKG